MKIAIIGLSNLGAALTAECRLHAIEIRIYRHSEIPEIPHFNPDLVINTAGGNLNCDRDTLSELNLLTNYNLSIKYPTLAFSSNAVLEPGRSDYSNIKWQLETLANMTPNLSIIRVSNLYGWYNPSKTFPFKLRQRYPHPCTVSLPDNPIQPTPVRWLAEKIIDQVRARTLPKLSAIVPLGSTSPLEWGEKILGHKYEFVSSGMDEKRPIRSLLDSNYHDHWKDLWDQFK